MNTDRYRVVGNPIEQSKSPIIHRLFAEQTKQDIEYDKYLVEVGEFNKEAQAFFDAGGRGMNVTAPFKGDACEFADTLTDRARLASAVNTLAIQKDGSVLGENTDGPGLVWDLNSRLGWDLRGKRVLILGSGGATRGVLYSLLEAETKEIYVANRTASKAISLAELFSEYGEIKGGGFDSLSKEKASFDIVLNATSASLSGALPDVSSTLIQSASCVYDMVYGKELTPFLRWAKELGVENISDGLGMLVGQAAESFELWRSPFVPNGLNVEEVYQMVVSELRG